MERAIANFKYGSSKNYKSIVCQHKTRTIGDQKSAAILEDLSFHLLISATVGRCEASVAARRLSIYNQPKLHKSAFILSYLKIREGEGRFIFLLLSGG